MTTQMEAYLEASDRVYEQLRSLVDAEQEKRQALLDHNMDRLSEILHAQQAQVMRLEGLEKKRLQAQQDAGFGGLTGSQIAARLDGSDKTRMEESLKRLTGVTDELRELNRLAMDIADSELKLIDMLLRSSQEKTSGLYTAGGKKGAGRGQGAAFEEKI